MRKKEAVSQIIVSGKVEELKNFHKVTVGKNQNPCSECGHPVFKGCFGSSFFPKNLNVPEEIVVKVVVYEKKGEG